MNEIILTLMIFSSYIYYAITYLLGLNKGTISESYFSIFIGIVSILVTIYSFYRAVITKKIKINERIFLIMFILIISLLSYNYYESVSHFKLISIVYIFPSLIYGVFCLEEKMDIKKHLIFLMYLFTICSVPFILNYIRDGVIVLRNGFGSGTYQNAGYCFAYAYVINLFLYKKKKIIKLPLLLLQFTSCVVSTASGPFVVCIVATIIYYFDYMKKNKFSLKKILSTIILVLIASYAIYYFSNSVFQNAYEAIITFFSFEKGLDLEAAGRSEVYTNALNIIRENPLGCGIFGYYRFIEYPHNIILETMLQGGILYTFLIILILFRMYSKIIVNRDDDELFSCLKPLLIVNLIMLLVSGTYMVNALFWFCFIVSMGKGNKKVQKFDIGGRVK